MNDLTGNSSSSPSGAAPDRRLIMAGIALVLVACAGVCVLDLAAGTWAIYAAIGER